MPRPTAMTFSGRKLEPAIYPDLTVTIAVALKPADSGTVEHVRGTLMGRLDDGTYAPYDSTATDGSQQAVGFLVYDVSVDTLGEIVFTTTAGATGEVGVHTSNCPIYIGGYLFGADLIQAGDAGVVDAGALDDLKARWINGDLTDGILKF